MSCLGFIFEIESGLKKFSCPVCGEKIAWVNMRRILLASKSERRISWLKENLKIQILFFSSALKSIEIKAPKGFEVSKQVEIVCQSKAENARRENKPSVNRRDGNYDAILVSDTMIEDPDDSRLSIGKPKDALTATSNRSGLQEENTESGRRHPYSCPERLLQERRSGTSSIALVAPP